MFANSSDVLNKDPQVTAHPQVGVSPATVTSQRAWAGFMSCCGNANSLSMDSFSEENMFLSGLKDFPGGCRLRSSLGGRIVKTNRFSFLALFSQSQICFSKIVMTLNFSGYDNTLACFDTGRIQALWPEQIAQECSFFWFLPQTFDL